MSIKRQDFPKNFRTFDHQNARKNMRTNFAHFCYVDFNQFTCFQRIRLPIALPQGAPPVSLIGFKIISIHYVDNNVIDFLLRIRQLCKSGITLKFSSDNKRSIDIVSRHIMPHFKSIISGLKLSNSSCCVEELRSHCSPKILLECLKLQSISCQGIISQAGQAIALYEWLHTPRGDNHPKMLNCSFVEESLDELKMNFLNATTPVSYIFLFYDVLYDVATFELMNRQTRERLTFFKLEPRPGCRQRKCVERSPIARDEKQWKQWEQEALNLYGTSIKNVIEVCSHDRDF
ncbi:hypothetical protein GPALN_012026 [Globodera pallida]|nr:hypothetical protein GPALN_012026 [Globodera pallida]